MSFPPGSAAQPLGAGAPDSASRAWRHSFSRLLVACTLALIFVGGLVTSTGSGLSVPDWPLSYGMLMPPMVGGVFYEHLHRMAAASVGLLTLLLALWTARREPRPGVRRLAWWALATVIVQGGLGGLTVLFLLPMPVSVAHACLAQTFFCVVVTLAFTTSREWLAASPGEDAAGLRAAALSATGAAFAQLALGAAMRHMGAALAIPDFPLAFGRILPPFASAGIVVHFAHRVGALVVLATLLLLWTRARRSDDRRFTRPAALALAVAVLQIALGGATVLTGKAELPTTLHVTTGAALLGTCWFLVLRAQRHLPAAPTARAWTPLPSAAQTT